MREYPESAWMAFVLLFPTFPYILQSLFYLSTFLLIWTSTWDWRLQSEGTWSCFCVCVCFVCLFFHFRLNEVRLKFAVTFRELRGFRKGEGEGRRWKRHESWYTLLGFCFFSAKSCKETTQKLTHICKIIDIQSFSCQLYEIIIDYLLMHGVGTTCKNISLSKSNEFGMALK